MIAGTAHGPGHTECDQESASNTAVAGYSLTSSVASSYLGQHRY